MQRPDEGPESGGPVPTVTVVVPCYNYGRFLTDSVSSALNQQGVDVDVVIVDDASSDDSAERAEALSKGDRRVRLVRHATNHGHISTYNEGLSLAEGDYVVLLDADDVIAPGALQRATALMHANPAVGMTYGHPRNFSGSVPPPTADTGPTRSWSIWNGPDWIAAQCRRGLSIVYSPEVVMRNSIRRDAGEFRAELPHSADLEMWLRMAAVAGVGRINGPDQAYRRIHPSSMMQTDYSSLLLDLRGRLEAYDSFFDRAMITPAAQYKLRRAVCRKLADEALGYVNARLAAQPSAAPRSDELDAYLDFAQATCARASELASWREYRARTALSGRRRAARSRIDAARRDLASRLTWQRWYWNGY